MSLVSAAREKTQQAAKTAAQTQTRASIALRMFPNVALVYYRSTSFSCNPKLCGTLTTSMTELAETAAYFVNVMSNRPQELSDLGD